MVLISVVLSWRLTLILGCVAPKVGMVDIPNERSSHKIPTPRGGGLSFVVVSTLMIIVFILFEKVETKGVWNLIVGSLMVAAVSLADDRWHLHILVRFGTHIISAIVFLVSAGWIQELVLPGGITLHLGFWGLPITFIWIIGLTNAFNFMDGIDGLAAGQAVIASITLALIALINGAGFVAIAMLLIAGSVIGFLPQNWPPAKLFMGDVGSAFLGFVFAGWSVLASKSGSEQLPFVACLAMFSTFVFDTIATLIGRILRGQRWYEAHREHFYQRLIRRGWSHLAVTMLYLGSTTFIGLVVIANYGYRAIASFVFIGLVALPLLGIVIVVRWVESRHERNRSDEPTSQST